MPRPRIVAPVAAPLLVLAVLGGACKEPEATPAVLDGGATAMAWTVRD